MYSLILMQTLPLEKPDERPPAGMAFDGTFVYVCAAGKPVIYQYDIHGGPCRRIRTAGCYQSLCYDPSEGCFWGLPYGGDASLHQLDNCFRPTCTIPVRLACAESLCDLFCGGDGDSFLLSGRRAVYRTTKTGALLCRTPLAADAAGRGVGELCGRLVYGVGFSGSAPDILCQPNDGDTEHIGLLPPGYTLTGLCPAYGPQGDRWIYISASYAFSDAYLLKYQAVNTTPYDGAVGG